MNHSGTNSCCQLLSRTNRVASISIPSVFDLTPVVFFFKSTTQLVLVVCWCVNESRTPSSWKVLCSKKLMLVHMYCSSAYCKVVLSSKETNLYQAKHPHTHSHRAHGHKIGLELILKLAMYFFPIGRGNQRKKVKKTNISWLTQPSSPKSSWWVRSCGWHTAQWWWEIKVSVARIERNQQGPGERTRRQKRVKVKSGWRGERDQKEEVGQHTEIRVSSDRETGRLGEKAIMWTNRDSITAFPWQKWEANLKINGDKMSWEQIWRESEGRNEGESERRQETLMFGGVNHWACRRKRRAVLEWQVCWAKTLIRLAVLPWRRQSISSRRGEERRPTNAKRSRLSLKWPTYNQSSASFPWVNIYDNHKGESSVISKSHLSLRRFTSAAIFIVTMPSITCVSTLKWPFCCCLCNKIHVTNTLICITLHWNAIFLA